MKWQIKFYDWMFMAPPGVRERQLKIAIAILLPLWIVLMVVT